MNYLPISVNLKFRPVLVYGGGEIAFRKVSLLLNFGAIIKVVSDNLCENLNVLYNNKKIYWISKKFNKKQLSKVFLVIIATDNNKFNSYVYKKANNRFLLVNVVDNKSKCSFIFPSIINRSPIIVSISSGGNAPILCCMLREKIESILPYNFGKIASLSGKWRKKISKYFNDISVQRKFWRELFSGIFTSYILNGNTHSAIKNLKMQMKKKYTIKGEVVLIGAGPGDKDLLTLKGFYELQDADIILYDSLVNKDILDFARRDAKLVFVGKVFKKSFISQNEINNILVSMAQKGNKVVRLKGGDGFIFGRGGEELEALKNAQISYRVIPGITAAIGIAAYTGIPLTHRFYSNSVTFFTGYSIKSNFINWLMLSKNSDTTVIYMGINQVYNIYHKFILYGKSFFTPIVFVENGTTFKQRVLIGTLEDMIELSKNISSPALLIIGKVVNLYKKLMWFNNSTFI